MPEMRKVRVVCKPDQSVKLDMVDAGEACVGTISDILNNLGDEFCKSVTQEDVQVSNSPSDPDVFISKH